MKFTRPLAGTKHPALGRSRKGIVSIPQPAWRMLPRAGVTQPQIRIIMAKLTSPRELLVEELKDLYSAENQLIKALPRMAKAANSDELKSAFETHLDQTRVQAGRLEKIMKQLDESPKGKTCKAMNRPSHLCVLRAMTWVRIVKGAP